MIPYQDQELFLITSVVYSEKFQAVEVEYAIFSTFLFAVIFISSDSFQLKCLASSSVSGELAITNFSFPLVFSREKKWPPALQCSSQRVWNP